MSASAQAPGESVPPSASPAGLVPGTQEPASRGPVAQEPVAQEPASQAAPAFGRLLTAGRLRCWPGNVAEPPVFEDTMAAEQIVQVGRSENGFRAVLTPLGPLGYVSRKFTEASPDGRVKSKGSKVAFRYRPRTSEAPVTQLAEGTELHVVGEQDDWYRVRVPAVEAWLPEGEVQGVDAADPAVIAGFAALRSQQEAEVNARLDAIKKQMQQEQQNKIDLAAVKVVEEAFAAELKKPVGEQQFAPLTEALQQLEPTLAAESQGRPAVAALHKRIETQRWIAEASAAVQDRPPLPDAPPPETKDDLERFQSIGWVRYESRLAAPGIYFLEKGGQRLCLLSCNSSRYDLALFVDREVGVIGPRRRPLTESLSVLDAERIEVLGTTKR